MKRGEMDRAFQWSLEDLVKGNEQWEAEFQRLTMRISALEGFQGRLGAEDALKEALDNLFEADYLSSKLYAYAHMRRDEDNTKSEYQALTDRAQAAAVQLSSAGAYITPELLALPETYLARVMERPEFSDYRVFLKDIQRRRPHTRSAEAEQIAAMTGEMGAAPDTIYSMLSDADMRFPMVKDGKGGEVRLTHANYIPLMMNRDREVRKTAFEAMYTTYKQYENTIPAIYSASVKSDLFYARTARHPSAIESALFPDEIPLSVYDNLIEAVHAHLPALQKYLSLCAKANGLDDPHMYDIYLPTPGEFELNLPFEEAYELVIDCLKPLGEAYQRQLRTARKERWMDVYPNEGKSSGAYSWGAYGCHPFVLLNYHEDLDGLLTVAHEMGHSMHSYYSNAAQPYPTADYSLFVAEVASTVNEVLVLMELMERHPEPQARRYLLGNLLDSFRTTVFRQTMFAEFERESHRMAEAGQALTGEALNAVYARLNTLYHAPAIHQDELIALEWMRIPHFYRAFYVYKYATGFSAAMTLAAGIRREGEAAVERYRKFLSAGSSVSPIEALRLAGVDMESPAPVNQALDEFSRMVDEFQGYLEGKQE